MIGIIDYGMGNLRSVQKAFEHIGAEVCFVADPAGIARVEKLILPGVGAFSDAMKTIREKGLVEPIIEAVGKGKWFLGICLGMQLLFDVSFEDGEHEGLGIIPGEVKPFDFNSPDTQELKVPHMGWNCLNITNQQPLLKGLDDGVYTYFVHSYYVDPTDKAITTTSTPYGIDFTSTLCRENVMATQFHPEKSQRVGMRMLENFAAL